MKPFYCMSGLSYLSVLSVCPVCLQSPSVLSICPVDMFCLPYLPISQKVLIVLSFIQSSGIDSFMVWFDGNMNNPLVFGNCPFVLSVCTVPMSCPPVLSVCHSCLSFSSAFSISSIRLSHPFCMSVGSALSTFQ